MSASATSLSTALSPTGTPPEEKDLDFERRVQTESGADAEDRLFLCLVSPAGFGLVSVEGTEPA